RRGAAARRDRAPGPAAADPVRGLAWSRSLAWSPPPTPPRLLGFRLRSRASRRRRFFPPPPPGRRAGRPRGLRSGHREGEPEFPPPPPDGLGPHPHPPPVPDVGGDPRSAP